MKLKESVKRSKQYKTFVRDRSLDKIQGKYKDFKYEITISGWEIKHRHFGLCHVFDRSYPFVKFNKEGEKISDFNIKDKKHVSWVRKYIYRECERELKNPWWVELDKKDKVDEDKNEKIKGFPLVKVRWLDAQTGFSQLMPISEFKREFKPFYNYSFGYLLEDNKDNIILGFLLMDSEIVNEETGVKHWQLIPKGMVKEIIKIHSPKACETEKN